jgi:hypothetical protein
MAGRRNPGSFDREVAHVLGTMVSPSLGPVHRPARFAGKHKSRRKVAGLTEERPASAVRLETGFPTRDAAAFAVQSRTIREVFATMYEAAGLTYEEGQLALAARMGRPLRTIERSVSRLAEGGFAIVERKEGGKSARPAVVHLHPNSASFLVAVEGPSRPRGTVALPGRLEPDSVALRCAAIGSWRRARALAIPYVVGLMTERERAIVAYAAGSGGGPVCDDLGLSAELIEYFQHLAWWERHAAAERLRGGKNRAAQLRDDATHFIADHNEPSHDDAEHEERSESASSAKSTAQRHVTRRSAPPRASHPSLTSSAYEVRS